MISLAHDRAPGTGHAIRGTGPPAARRAGGTG